jgi:hypothetical protein
LRLSYPYTARTQFVAIQSLACAQYGSRGLNWRRMPPPGDPLPSQLNDAFENLLEDVYSSSSVESIVAGLGTPPLSLVTRRRRLKLHSDTTHELGGVKFPARVQLVVANCRAKRQIADLEHVVSYTEQLSENYVDMASPFARRLKLDTFKDQLHFVPRIVNVVTVT